MLKLDLMFKIIIIKYVVILLSCVFIVASCTKKNVVNQSTSVETTLMESVKMVPKLPDDYPDYYAKCSKCGYIWKTPSDELCSCGTNDNKQVYDWYYWKKSSLYESLNQEDLLFADINQEDKTITIGFRNRPKLFKRYDNKNDFYNDWSILWNGCGPAEYVYHSLIAVENALKDKTSKSDNNITYPNRDIIYFSQDGDKQKVENGKLFIESKNGKKFTIEPITIEEYY